MRGQRERREDRLESGEEEHREDSPQDDEQDGRATLRGKRGQGQGGEHGHTTSPAIPHSFEAQAQKCRHQRGQRQGQQGEQEERGPHGNCGRDERACRKAARKQYLGIRAQERLKQGAGE